MSSVEQDYEKIYSSVMTALNYLINEDISDNKKNVKLRGALKVAVHTIVSELKKYRLSYKKEIILNKFIFYNPFREFVFRDDFNEYYKGMESKITDTNYDLVICKRVTDYIIKADILNNIDFVKELIEFLYFIFKQSFNRLQDAYNERDILMNVLKGIGYIPQKQVDLNEEQYKQELDSKFSLLLK